MRFCSACRGDYEDPDVSADDEPSEPEVGEDGEPKIDVFPERRG